MESLIEVLDGVLITSLYVPVTQSTPGNEMQTNGCAEME